MRSNQKRAKQREPKHGPLHHLSCFFGLFNPRSGITMPKPRPFTRAISCSRYYLFPSFFSFRETLKKDKIYTDMQILLLHNSVLCTQFWAVFSFCVCISSLCHLGCVTAFLWFITPKIKREKVSACREREKTKTMNDNEGQSKSKADGREKKKVGRRVGRFKQTWITEKPPNDECVLFVYRP